MDNEELKRVLSKKTAEIIKDIKPVKARKIMELANLKTLETTGFVVRLNIDSKLRYSGSGFFEHLVKEFGGHDWHLYMERGQLYFGIEIRLDVVKGWCEAMSSK